MVDKKTTKIENKKEEKIETKKVESKAQDSKIVELKIELLKQGSKKRDIRREIARLLTLQNKPVEEKKK